MGKHLVNGGIEVLLLMELPLGFLTHTEEVSTDEKKSEDDLLKLSTSKVSMSGVIPACEGTLTRYKEHA